MKFLFVAALLVFVVVGFRGEASPPLPSEETIGAPQVLPVVVSPAESIAVTAQAYGVFDIETGELLFAHNADNVLPIASVTKLFTAAAVFEASAVTEELTITPEDVATFGRAGNLQAGQTYTAHELLFPLLLESSNDAGTAIKRTLGTISVAGRALADGSGLSSHNRASVEELAEEVRNLYFSQPHIFDITRLSQYIGTYTGWLNNSPVKDLPGYRGGKHGYTEAAGRTLVAIFAEPNLEGRELGYIILGSADIKADTLALREVVERSVQLQ
jgi:serine-type D-Ala-D-Ala endopeptidase (penicillin-binding protein 7)